jgi:hypothetical protein
MTLLWPWSLLALLAVGAAALWTLFRPGRQLAVVASLELWQRAFDTLDRSQRRRCRRSDAAWVLLLAGAAAAVLGLARPVYRDVAGAREVAVAIHCGAELTGRDGTERMRAAVAALLERLDERDRVQLVLPVQLGGQSAWLSAREALRRVGGLTALAVATRELAFAEAPQSARHLYRFTTDPGDVQGPDVTVIRLPSFLARIAIDAIGASPAPDGRAELFVALRNHGQAPWEGRLAVRTAAPDGRPSPGGDSAVVVAPGGRRQILLRVPTGAAIEARLLDAAGKGVSGIGAAAFLVRRDRRAAKVAMVGRDHALLRRFVRVHPALELIGRAEDADVVIANGRDAPPGKAALVIAPPTAPPGWRLGDETASSVRLDAADLAAADAVMRHVHLRAVAVRRLRPWVAQDPTRTVTLASYRGDALILRTVLPRGADPAIAPRRVYVAFDLSAENSNFAMTTAFPVFLAGVMDWLCPAAKAEASYGYVTPAQAGQQPGWEPVLPPAAVEAPRPAAALPWPGVYRDAGGQLHAVSLVGLGGPIAAPGAADAAKRAELPPPGPVVAEAELWPLLAAAAVVLWLLGWALRFR